MYTGCATRDNTDFQLFTVQTAILVEETNFTIRSAHLLAELNLMEAIADGNSLLLEHSILQRNGPFMLRADSLSIVSGLITAESKSKEAMHAFADYTLLLAEITRPEGAGIQLNSISSSETALLAGAIAALVEQGTAERDAETLNTAMMAAAPAVDSICLSMAAVTQCVANTVQASYADMAARRQMNITVNDSSLENVEELFVLNREVTTLLRNLEMLQESWLSIPAIHEELRTSLSEASVSVTLRVLAERMNEIREDGK